MDGDHYLQCARVAEPCRPDKPINYPGAKAHAGERFVADQIIDAYGFFVLSRWRQRALPGRVVVEQITLGKPDRAALSFNNEQLSRVEAVDAGPVAFLDRAKVIWLAPPRLYVRARKPI